MVHCLGHGGVDLGEEIGEQTAGVLLIRIITNFITRHCRCWIAWDDMRHGDVGIGIVVVGIGSGG